MIGTYTVRVSAAHPDVPLRELPAFAGSACSVGVLDVPTYFGGVHVSGVTVSVENANGETTSVPATRAGHMWVATFDNGVFATPGSVRNGLTVTAIGTAEDGVTDCSWTLGKGDICIMSTDGVPTPGMSWQNVHLMDEVPEEPQKGDLAKVDGAWRIYTGSEWDAIGRFGDYDNLYNKPQINRHELAGNKTAADLGLATSDDVESVEETASMALNAISQHAGNTDNPHDVTAEQVGTYTQAEIDDKITRFVAHYLTAKNAEGRFVPFATHAALAYAKTHHTEDAPQFFYAGQGFTPTKNDYCVVLADETYGGKTTRYSFVGDWPTGQFQYQYTINDTAFSQAQWDAINSGVTEDKVAEIDAKADEFTAWEFGGSDKPSGTLTLKYDAALFWLSVDGVPIGTHSVAMSEDSVAIDMMIDDDGNQVDITATRKRVLRTGDAATPEQVDAVSDKVDEIKSAVSTDNRLLVDDTTATVQTREDEETEWSDEIRLDKGYDAVQGETMVKLDKSVQTVTVAGGTLTVELPDAVGGTVRDLCLYVNNTSPTEAVTLNFPTGVTAYKTKGGDDPKAAAQAGGLTAYYFTEIPGGAWRLFRDELEVVA